MTYRTTINGSVVDTIDADSPLLACVVAMEANVPPHERDRFYGGYRKECAFIETGAYTIEAEAAPAEVAA